MEGNRYFSQREILSRSGLKTGDDFKQEDLDAGLKMVLSYYSREGFYFARIDSVQKEYSPDSADINIRIFLNEGFTVDWGEVQIRDNKGQSLAEYEGSFPASKSFRPQAMNEALEGTLMKLEDSGHPFGLIKIDSLDLQRCGESIALNHFFELEPGPRVKIAGVEVKGNKITRRNFIIREMRLKQGALFSQSEFNRARKYLLRTDLFEAVEPLQIILRDNQFLSLVKVKEKRQNLVNGALGYYPATNSEAGYWSGLVDLAFNNLFGTGRRFSLHWSQPQPNSQDLSLAYREPWIFNLPLNAEALIEQSLRPVQDYNTMGGEQRYFNRTISVSGDYLLNENWEFSGGLDYNEVLPDSVSRYVLNIPHSLSSGYNLGFVLNTQDDLVYPQRGIKYQNRVQFYRKKNYLPPNSSLPDEVNEQRYELDFEVAISVEARIICDLALHSRYLQTGQEYIPISELYFLGGANSLRGYREEQFPGSSIGWMNLEFRFPFEKQSGFTLFADYGYYQRQIETSGGEMDKIQGMRLGYGAGLRLKTGMGLFGIDYGLAEGEAPMRGKLHFRLRNEF